MSKNSHRILSLIDFWKLLGVNIDIFCGEMESFQESVAYEGGISYTFI